MPIKRHRYRAYPSLQQQQSFQQIFGSCRFVYNWALDIRIKEYEEQKKAGVEKIKSSSIYDISKKMTLLKKEEEFKWLNDVPSIALIWSLNNLDTAFKNFFRRIKQKATPGFPKFKSRHRSQKAFSFHQGYDIDLSTGTVTVPKNGGLKFVLHRIYKDYGPKDIKQVVPLDNRRFLIFFNDNNRVDIEYKTCTVVQEPSGKYYVSFVVNDFKPAVPLLPLDKQRLTGIDVGIVNALSFSDGHRINMNLDFIRDEKRILKLSRQMSRKVHGKGIPASINFGKAKIKLAKAHERIRLKRKYEIERICCELVDYMDKKGYCGLVMRKYDIKSMVDRDKIEKDENGIAKKNKRYIQRKINKKIMGGAMGMLCMQIRYKLAENAYHCLEFDADEITTTRRCGHCREEGIIINLKTRRMTCEKCGETEDIDWNAAENVLWHGLENIDTKSIAS